MSGRLFVRSVTLLTVLAVIGAACGGDGGDAATTTASTTTTSDGDGSAAGEEQPPAELAEADFGEDALDPQLATLAASREANGGLLGLQEAIDLFAATHGEVPGADGTRFVPGPRDGTMATRAVFRLWDGLTGEQQTVVLGLLGFGSGGEARAVSVAYAPPAAGPSTLEGLQSMAEFARDQISSLTGVELGLELEVATRDTYPVAGEAIPVGAGGPFTPPFNRCLLILEIPVTGSHSLSTTIAHEVFHCFQYASPSDSDSVPDWIIEGSAQWVGARLGGPDIDVHETIHQWFVGSTGSLFTKSYDAVGFYFAVEQAGVTPWSFMLEMLGKSNQGAVAATGLSPEEAVRWMGTTNANADQAPALPVSAVWQIAAREPAGALRPEVTVTEDSPYRQERSLPHYSRYGTWVFTLEEEVATVTVNASAGALEFYEKEPTIFEGKFRGKYCLREEGCSCGPEEDPELMEGSENMVLAIGSLGGSASVSVEVEDIDDGGFEDGHWTGELIATPIVTRTDGSVTVGDPLGAPFEFDVSQGEVTGDYSVQMHQEMTAPDMRAEGVGTVTGAVAGCWFSPELVPAVFSFEGTATTEHGTVPFNFSQPLGPGGPGIIRWDFDEDDDPDSATGTLATQVFLDYMESVGVGVNNVEIRFTATRTG